MRFKKFASERQDGFRVGQPRIARGFGQRDAILEERSRGSAARSGKRKQDHWEPPSNSIRIAS